MTASASFPCPLAALAGSKMSVLAGPQARFGNSPNGSPFRECALLAIAALALLHGPLPVAEAQTVPAPPTTVVSGDLLMAEGMPFELTGPSPLYLYQFTLEATGPLSPEVDSILAPGLPGYEPGATVVLGESVGLSFQVSGSDAFALTAAPGTGLSQPGQSVSFALLSSADTLGTVGLSEAPGTATLTFLPPAADPVTAIPATAVPEPGAMWLIGAGLAGLGLIARRRGLVAYRRGPAKYRRRPVA